MGKPPPGGGMPPGGGIPPPEEDPVSVLQAPISKVATAAKRNGRTQRSTDPKS